MCLQVLEYDQATQNIHMAGEIDDTSQLYKKMKSYLPGLTLINGEMNFRATVESPAQIYFDLFLAKSCV